jgi:hypothetical protein
LDQPGQHRETPISNKREERKPGLVTLACNSNTWEAKEERPVWAIQQDCLSENYKKEQFFLSLHLPGRAEKCTPSFIPQLRWLGCPRWAEKMPGM